MYCLYALFESLNFESWTCFWWLCAVIVAGVFLKQYEVVNILAEKMGQPGSQPNVEKQKIAG